MIDTDKYEGVRTPFGIVPTEDILKMLEPIRERDNKIAELDAEVKRLREAIADIANNMEAADPSYLQGFIRDLQKVIE